MKNLLIVILLVLFGFSRDSRAQWVQTSGPPSPVGGNITCFAVSGTTLFAAINGNGVFCTTNDGKNWTPLDTTGMGDVYVTSLATSGPNLLAGTYGSGVFSSTNGGTTWSAVNNGLAGSMYIKAITVSGSNLFAVINYGGVVRSTNNGASWTAADSGLKGEAFYVNTIIIDPPDVFAGTDSGVFRSTDHGISWNAIDSGLPLNALVSAIAVQGTYLFVETLDSGVFRSSNNGANWNPANNGLPVKTSVSAFAVSGTNLFAATDNGIFLSNDSGIRWMPVENKLANATATTLAAIDSDLFAGTEGAGMFLSTNSGASWAATNFDTVYASVSTLTAIGTTLFANGVVRSTDSGATWTPATNAGLKGGGIAPMVVSGSNLFIGTDSGVFRSTDTGANWTRMDSGLTNTNVTALAVSDSNAQYPMIFAGTNSAPASGVFRSSDSARNWEEVGNNSMLAYGVTTLAVCGTEVFAGTFGVGISQSTDNGISWTDAGLGGNPINTFLVNGADLFVGTGSGIYVSNGLFLSKDSTPSWMEAGLDLMSVNAIVANETNLFAGTNNGVFLSTDNGISWTSENTGLRDSEVLSLAIIGTNLFAGTTGGGVWRRPLSEFIPSGVSSAPPSFESKIECYPNPFTQSTTISFTSPESGDAEIMIVNILGAQVTQLFSGELSAGEHSFLWDDPTGSPAGMYKCIVRMNGQVQQIPIILSR